MAEIGTLTINLVTNTASFEGGMDKASQLAKKAARGIQNDLNGIDLSEARGGIMVLGEEIGVHLPRHVQAFIATLPGVGAAMSAAFPLLAIVAIGVAIVEVAEKLAKWREEAEKITQDQTKLGTAVNDTFNSLDQKLLQAGIHSDELSKNHLAALKKQLELINLQSMSELVHSFDVIAKAADVVFGDLKSHWYTFGIGADGAKHALTQFQTQYDSLLAQGKDKEASDLLAGTLQSAQKVLAFQKQYKDNLVQYDNGVLNAPTKAGDGTKVEEAKLALQKAGVGVTEKEVQAQQALVDALQAQVTVEGKVAALKKAQGDNARHETGDKIKDDHSKEAATQLQEDLARIDLLKSAATEAYVEMGHSIDEAKAHEDSMFSGAELQAHLEYFDRLRATAKTTAELNKVNADRQIFLDKTMAQANSELAAVRAKNSTDIAHLEEQNAQKSAKINEDTEKTQMGQIAAKVKAMMAEMNLRRAATDEEARVSALQQVHSMLRVRDIDTEIAQLKKLKDSEAETAQQKLAYDAAIHNAELKRLQDIQKELEATNTVGNAFKSFYLGLQAEALQTGQKIRQALDQTFQGMNQNLATFIVEGKANWKQFAATAIESFIQIGLQYVETKLLMMVIDKTTGQDRAGQNAGLAQSAAGLAAANTLADAPWPINIPASAAVLALGEGYAALTAAGFSAARGAVLPNREALVHTHPEEMILPQNISNFIQRAAAGASNGGGFGGGHIVFAPTIHAVDAEGVDRVLDKHADRFHKKYMAEMRRHNF